MTTAVPLDPRFPIYIPSKGRARISITPGVLDSMRLPYRIIVEASQFEEYAEVHGEGKLLVLPQEFIDDFDPLDDLGSTKPKGSGPARNFAWAHSIEQGAAWHWVMDDNIQLFAYRKRNRRIPAGDGLFFRAMEDFVLRYRNVAEAGPRYWMFAPSREPTAAPYTLNTRIFSCNLIRNDVAVRWRGRWNEDLDLAIQMLKAGWCTIEFATFLQYKTTTQTLAGGNTEAYRSSGTLVKSQMPVRVHPDVVRLARRYGRWHHVADFKKFAGLSLIRRDDAEELDAANYRTRIIPRDALRCESVETGTDQEVTR